MSEFSKHVIKEAGDFFDHVKKKAEEYGHIVPDKQLTEKIRKVGEGAGEVSEHIKKRIDH